MTFKQTEIVEILKKLNDYSEKYKILNRLIKETYNLYKKVPLYPGIVGMCIDNVLKETVDIEKGDMVIIEGKDNSYEGEVVEIKDDTIKLKQVKILREQESLEIKIDKSKVYKYNFSTLKQLWPSLDFDNKEK